MNVLFLLALFWLGLLFLVVGRKGLTIFTGFWGNIFLFCLGIFLFQKGFSWWLVLLLVGGLVIGNNLFYLNGTSVKTKKAALATGIVFLLFILLMAGLIPLFSLGGFGEEEVEELANLNFLVGLSFPKLTLSFMSLGMLGALSDSAMAITSALTEVVYHRPDLSEKEIFKSGMAIGKTILPTTLNTLFFAYVASFLALILWFMDLNYSFSQMVNSKVFASEIAATFGSALGTMLVIPVASFLMAFQQKKKKSAKLEENE